MRSNVQQAKAYARTAATARAKADRLARLARTDPRFAAAAKRAAWAADCAERIAAAHAAIARDNIKAAERSTEAPVRYQARLARARLKINS